MSYLATYGIKRTIIDHAIVERTDPDYVDKYVARMAKEYAALPGKWRKTFLDGITGQYRKDVEELINNSNTRITDSGKG